MRVFENHSFDSSFDDRDSGALFRDIEFRNCYFQGCSLSITGEPALRSTVRNVRMVGCNQRGCSLDAAIVEDVIVDGFRTNGQLFQTWGTVFCHVVLRGKIDDLMISNDVLPDLQAPVEYRDVGILKFREANAEHYGHVDWALDISQAEFKRLDIRGVPGHLIRRDRETQILVSRRRVLEGNWRDLPFREALAPFCLDFMLKQGMPDLVLVAPKRHRKFPLYVEDLQLLRQAGIAEAD